ncbi:MAG: hydrolase [Oscillospiraceae bacterium]|jgi:2-methylisocitrate lyase-like PEP mutase family enzyme|nr:hydrolase [Oscillospiraceae bacterium]
MENLAPKYTGSLRSFMLNVPEEIRNCSGIILFGRKLRSFLFSTDISIIANCNADAIIAVYPFTPQPIITQAVMLAAQVPVLAGVGGGWTKGNRVVDLARHAEFQGAAGVVVNAPTANDTITEVAKHIDIPIVVTVVNLDVDIDARLKAGAAILNVSAASKTPEVIRTIRKEFPQVGIIATGGPSTESVKETIAAGANAITWTPPSNGEVFKSVMDNYRNNKAHP